MAIIFVPLLTGLTWLVETQIWVKLLKNVEN